LHEKHCHEKRASKSREEYATGHVEPPIPYTLLLRRTAGTGTIQIFKIEFSKIEFLNYLSELRIVAFRFPLFGIFRFDEVSSIFLPLPFTAFFDFFALFVAVRH
jgi:hypothetical protein